MLAKQLMYRFAISIPVLLGVVLLGFALMMLVPSDPAAIIAGEGARPEILARIRVELGLDRSVIEQFLLYLGKIAQGDFGRSQLNGIPVLSEIGRAILPTMELLFVAMLLAVPTGLALGAIAAWWHGYAYDRAVMAFAAIGLSTPVFMVGMLLINVVGVSWGLLPVQGRGGPIYTLAGLQHILLPGVSLAMVLLGSIARMTRTSMLEIADQDFIRTARSKGLGERRVLIGHILRNALIPTVNLIGLQAGYLLGGIVITETIFAWPGLGRLAVEAITSRDAPMAQGTIVFLAISFVFINIVVDIITGLLDPRANRT